MHVEQQVWSQPAGWSPARARRGNAQLLLVFGASAALGCHLEEELEMVRDTLGAQVPRAGFSAYGELCPTGGAGRCALHNQTMTVTTFSER